MDPQCTRLRIVVEDLLTAMEADWAEDCSDDEDDCFDDGEETILGNVRMTEATFGIEVRLF